MSTPASVIGVPVTYTVKALPAERRKGRRRAQVGTIDIVGEPAAVGRFYGFAQLHRRDWRSFSLHRPCGERVAWVN